MGKKPKMTEEENKELLILKNEVLMTELLTKDIVVPQMENAISR